MHGLSAERKENSVSKEEDRNEVGGQTEEPQERIGKIGPDDSDVVFGFSAGARDAEAWVGRIV